MKRLIFALLLVTLASPAWAVRHPDEQLKNTALEARAKHLAQTLRCVVCQNESIEDSDADIARDLRILVRGQIMQGKSDTEIISYLRARYGDYITLEPPVAPRTYILWLMPALLLCIGSILIASQFRSRRR